MSGHSKWATIHRKKGELDALRGKVFQKLAKEIYVAAKSGSPDPDSNASLRMVIDALKEQGFNIQILSDEAFRARILAYSKSMNDSITAIVNDFNTTNLSLDYNFTVNIKSDFTQNALRSLGFTWRRIDKDYLNIIIKYMKDVNFI